MLPIKSKSPLNLTYFLTEIEIASFFIDLLEDLIRKPTLKSFQSANRRSSAASWTAMRDACNSPPSSASRGRARFKIRISNDFSSEL